MNNTRISAINTRKDLATYIVEDVKQEGTEKKVTCTPKLWVDIAVNAELVLERRFDAKKRIKGWRA